MLLTSRALWPRRRLARDEVRAEILNQMRTLPCWQCGKYLGSMLVFDFGEKVIVPGMRGRQIAQGEATLGVRDCYWKLAQGRQTIADSNSIDDESAADLLLCVQGAEICDLVVSKPDFIDLKFSNNVTLSLDTTNRNETQDCIAEFVVPDGRIYEVTRRGHYYLSGQVSTVRMSGTEKKRPEKKEPRSN
ncbi:hypothetical protein [Rhodoferax sp.]|uniref:hypothetical protein n=1 Tax=Rhodoferax sp. TaxID=50421 RepID=UPI0027602E47|nr:hypothetical protein [Rhodoferax sp.]